MSEWKNKGDDCMGAVNEKKICFVGREIDEMSVKMNATIAGV